MDDVLAEIETWRAQGQAVAVATVVRTWGSAPRGLGARLAVADDGRMAGSVSGGCVEAAVIENAREVLRSRAPRLLSFGVADETAWAVGLACGGRLEVFVEPCDDGLEAALRARRAARDSAALLTRVGGEPHELGARLLLRADGTVAWERGPLAPAWRTAAVEAARAALVAGTSTRVALGGSDAFVEVLQPAPQLVMVGGVHIALVLDELARALGWRTVIVDPRTAFGDRQRFPRAHALVHAWPDDALANLPLTSSTAVAVLTHDPKLDDPALRVALPSPAFYVGALGSRKTQERRRARLLEAGLADAQLARLHAPIGLDLGGRAPEEIALAVMAQIVAARHGKIAPVERAPVPAV